MTLFKQFEVLVTGSNLTPNFKKLRLTITLLITLVLSLLLLLSGLNSYETTRSNFEAQRARRQNNFQSLQVNYSLSDSPNPDFEILRKQEDSSREAFLNKVSQDILTNNIILLFLLIILSWLSLYFLLFPLSKIQEEKEKFLAEASHELRTPLAILYSQLSLSKDDKNLKSLQDSHQEALIEIKRLQNLSNTLLSELGENGQKLEKENIKILNLVSQIWEKLQPLNDKKIKLDLKIENELEIEANYTKIYQLLFNLLDNSLKYSLENSTIVIDLLENTLIIQNPTKSEHLKPGVGLGICQKISKELGLKLNFGITEKKFEVSLGF